jgi:hypothetical protein
MHPWVVKIRLITMLLIVLPVLMLAFLAHSLWIIPLFGLVFTVLYFLGKSADSTYSLLKLRPSIRAIFITFAIQLTVCGILYLIGRGFGSLLNDKISVPFALVDVVIAIGILMLGMAAAMSLKMLIKNVENSMINTEQEQEQSINTSDYNYEFVMSFDEQPVTVDNFFEGVYFGHMDYDESHKNIKSDMLPEAARPSAALIAETEARLGVEFPPLLKQLYLRQNGGNTGCLWVPLVENPSLELDDWRGVFSHDYCYLRPLNNLNTLYESYLDYMDEEEIAQSDEVHPLAKQYVVLCQRYADTTFLDYSKSSAQPRVGVVDFDRDGKQDVWFESFDAFFNALKRGDLVDKT